MNTDTVHPQTTTNTGFCPFVKRQPGRSLPFLACTTRCQITPKSSWNVDSADHRTRVHYLSVHLSWAHVQKTALFLHRVDTWPPPCIIQFPVTLLDAVLSENGLSRYPWASVATMITEEWWFLALVDASIEPNPDTLPCHQLIWCLYNLPEQWYWHQILDLFIFPKNKESLQRKPRR